MTRVVDVRRRGLQVGAFNDRNSLTSRAGTALEPVLMLTYRP